MQDVQPFIAYAFHETLLLKSHFWGDVKNLVYKDIGPFYDTFHTTPSLKSHFWGMFKTFE